MPKGSDSTPAHYQWAAKGDVNAFCGLMLDNIADMILMVGLLASVYVFPTDVALNYMIPGTAIGVLAGDLMFFGLALALHRKTGSKTITAMPLGLDTPSTFGMVFFVLGPAFVTAKNGGLDEHAAAIHAWHVGIAAIFVSGLFKLACAFGANVIRRIVPRAGLLGSLTSIALVLISFLPLIDVLHRPVVGLVALAIILTTLTAHIPLPFKLPGALGALLIAGLLFYAGRAYAFYNGGEFFDHGASFSPQDGLLPTGWLGAWSFEWVRVLFSRELLNYLPVIIPFALATVVGGIDCTESAAAAGDEFDTSQVVGVEAIATILAAMCGGVIQSTPYIGHPAYKAMGGRAAYVLATALFVGAAGLFGFFGYMYFIIPKAAVFPILIFVGLEITAQSFLATPRKHYTAVALSCIPALAYLAMIHVDRLMAFIDWSKVPASMNEELLIERMLSAGFVITSLMWASAMAAIVDRQLFRSAIYFGLSALFTLFGVMHSPFPGSPVFLPWNLPPEQHHELNTVLQFAAGYFLVAVGLIAWGYWLKTQPATIFPDPHPEG